MFYPRVTILNTELSIIVINKILENSTRKRCEALGGADGDGTFQKGVYTYGRV